MARPQRQCTHVTSDGARCEMKHVGDGLCSLHYQRRMAGGDMDAPKKGSAKICKMDGCTGGPVIGFGLCNEHYRKRRERITGPCSWRGCERPSTSIRRDDGLCMVHRRRRKLGLEMDAPVRTANLAVGSVRSTGGGYLKVKTKDGWVREHRHVMAQHLGRDLRDDEHVHHRNGNRTDNRIENLAVMLVGRHPAGQSIPDVLAYAREIIERYEPEKALHRQLELALEISS